MSGLYDDITFEIAGDEARFTRVRGACEEIFEFDIDSSREGQIFLLANRPVVCSGCAEDAPFCNTTPTENWTFQYTLSEDKKGMTLEATSTNDAFSADCEATAYGEAEDGTFFAPTSQIALMKD